MPNLPRGALVATSVLPVRARRLALLGLSVIATPALAEGFIDDSHGTLTLRNYYLDRDYKDDGAKTTAREWAQGFIMNVESGFTPGTVGFGLDTRGLMGGQAGLVAGPQRHRVAAGVQERQARGGRIFAPGHDRQDAFCPDHGEDR